MTKLRWLVPLRIIDEGRVAVVEADSREEALEKARASDWVECLGASHYVVRVAGSPRFEGPGTKPEWEHGSTLREIRGKTSRKAFALILEKRFKMPFDAQRINRWEKRTTFPNKRYMAALQELLDEHNSSHSPTQGRI
jgi:hypothetical protein